MHEPPQAASEPAPPGPQWTWKPCWRGHDCRRCPRRSLPAHGQHTCQCLVSSRFQADACEVSPAAALQTLLTWCLRKWDLAPIFSATNNSEWSHAQQATVTGQNSRQMSTLHGTRANCRPAAPAAPPRPKLDDDWVLPSSHPNGLPSTLES